MVDIHMQEYQQLDPCQALECHAVDDDEEEEIPYPTAAEDLPLEGGKDLPLHDRFTIQKLVQRAHEGLGHPHRERFLRILRYAKAKPEVIEEAKKLQCSVCARHQEMKPARRAAPPRELGVNEIVGVDVIYLPTGDPHRSRPALNIIDWGTKFQMVIPLPGQSKKSEDTREAYRHWLRFFGPPKTLAVDLGREFKGAFLQRAATDGSCVDPAAVEAPYQRAITERHGKTIKYMLMRAMDQYGCDSDEDWEELVDAVCMMKNRLMFKNGYSPIQRVLGYNPRLPGGILTGDADNEVRRVECQLGDKGVERSMQIRKAAAFAFMEADCSETLRRAITSGPRVLQDFDIGEIVYFYRMGADKALRYNPTYWQGPGRVVMVDGPGTVWIAYNGKLVKATPERVRRASMEENLSLTGWIDEITDARRQLDLVPKDIIDLTKEPLPDDLQDNSNYEPDWDHHEPERPPMTDPPPKRRYHMKGPPPLPLTDDDILDQPLDEYRDPALREPADVSSKIETEEARGEKREAEDVETPDTEREHKRSRLEMLEIYNAKIEKLMQSRTKKEIRLPELSIFNRTCFHRAIEKEVNNNIKIGAYMPLSMEESARIRQVSPEKVMESRFVLTAKPLDPEDVQGARDDKILLEWDSGEPCKAKARHVMKGYSEEGAELLEASTPQVTREGALFVTQMVASHKWKLGFMDFTQAFHSGDLIERELYAEQPREGIPNMVPGQLMRIQKTCYGLTDGPLAWYRHLRKLLVDQLHYKQSLADPCIFMRHSPTGTLSGIVAVATDDLLHGGDAEHLRRMEQIKAKYKLGKYQFTTGRFTGKNFHHEEDYSITIHQDHYVRDIKPVDMTRSRKKQRFSLCNDLEISQLRACLGALSWLAKETRPDIAGRVALLQQSLPHPRVRDLIEANAIITEAQAHPTSGLRLMPIPPENLRVGVATDASWANSKMATTLEESSKDTWQEVHDRWIRHHVTPRRTLFHPASALGPDLHHLRPERTTRRDDGLELHDHWNDREGHRAWHDEDWVGTTTFFKQPPGQELPASDINELFLQLLNCNSQGGFVMMFYDKRLETEEGPHNVSVTAWKSTKLKRKTVNTLSAECQSLIHGVGHVHWHRYLLVEVLNPPDCEIDWERRLASVPYVAVVDSKSLFDCLNKLVCTYSQVDDKRTAIDVAILKDEMCKSGGHIRWVEGKNMPADSLTKRMPGDFLRLICNQGVWALSSKGHEKIQEHGIMVLGL